jgi:phosphoribosylformylglycinamidine cyclo-ligase
VSKAYAGAGVDTDVADRGVGALVHELKAIAPGDRSRTVPLPGHYASVLEIAPNLGVALATDSVGSKVIVAEQMGRFDTIGIDCVAMNVNDLVCVGARPLALVDYIAVEKADENMLREIGVGLRAGAEAAEIEIPGGEVCQVPEVIRGHPSPRGFDLVGSAFGTVAVDRIVDGSAVSPGDAVIGLPSSGVHANGLTLARQALLQRGGMSLTSVPAELQGASVGEVLLAPTAIYVRALLELLASDVPVHGLAHITGGGLFNLLRIGGGIGYEISSPLPTPPIFQLIAERGEVAEAEMWEVFNMGCGMCAMVPSEHADDAIALLGRYHPGTAIIGRVTESQGEVALPGSGLRLTPGGSR